MRDTVERAIADTVRREFPQAEVLMGTATAGIGPGRDRLDGRALLGARPSPWTLEGREAMGKNSKGKATKQPAPGERQVIANNKKARHDYTILDTYEAGMVLTGTEVKSLREGKASLVDGFAVFYRDELWLEQVYIPEYLNGSWTNHAARRRRKLLLHRAELTKISRQIQDPGLTIVPLSLYFLNGRVKVEIGVARGNREYDKRHKLREQQDNREAQRAMRMRNRHAGVA